MKQQIYTAENCGLECQYKLKTHRRRPKSHSNSAGPKHLRVRPGDVPRSWNLQLHRGHRTAPQATHPRARPAHPGRQGGPIIF